MKCRLKHCKNQAHTTNLCKKHYARKLRTGSIRLKKKVRKDPNELKPNKQGYIDVNYPGHPIARANGKILLHRMVAWDAGLLTDPSMIVHHINGDRTDNRLENLEILTKEEHDTIPHE